MASPVIQFKRGLLTNLPGLRAGEPGFTTDSYDLYVGLTSETATNQIVGSGRFWTNSTSSTGSGVNLVEGTSNGTSYVTIKSPDSLAGVVTYTMPGTDGSSGQVLATNGSGTLSFIDSAANLSMAGDSGTDTVALLTDTLTFAGTANEIETAVTNNQVQIGLPDDVTIGNDLTVTGALTANGDVTLGNAGADTVTVVGVATFTTSNVYIDNELFVGGIQVTGSASETSIGDDITTRNLSVTGVSTFTGAIDANGGADISGGETTLSSATVSDLTSGRVVLAGTSGALEDSGNLTFDGSTLDVTGNITVSGTVDGRDVLDDGQAGDNLVTLSGVSRDSTDLGTFTGGTISDSRTVKQALQDLETSLEAVDLTITTAEGTNGTGGGGGSVATSQTMTFAGTTNEIDVTVSGQSITYGLPNDVTVSNNLTVTGNLYVNGSTTQVNTSQTTIEDQLLELGMVDGSAPSSDLNKDLGVLFNYYSGSAKKSAVYWDDSASRVVISDDVSESSGVLTAASHAAVEIGSLWVNDCAGQSQVINCSGSERTLENITVDGGTF
jgi:hypothetical protein